MSWTFYGSRCYTRASVTPAAPVHWRGSFSTHKFTQSPCNPPRHPPSHRTRADPCCRRRQGADADAGAPWEQIIGRVSGALLVLLAPWVTCRCNVGGHPQHDALGGRCSRLCAGPMLDAAKGPAQRELAHLVVHLVLLVRRALEGTFYAPREADGRRQLLGAEFRVQGRAVLDAPDQPQQPHLCVCVCVCVCVCACVRVCAYVRACTFLLDRRSLNSTANEYISISMYLSIYL